MIELLRHFVCVIPLCPCTVPVCPGTALVGRVTALPSGASGPSVMTDIVPLRPHVFGYLQIIACGTLLGG